MVAAMIPWPRYRLGEPPPIRVDCPLHLGQVLPCPVCLEWLRDGRVALAGQAPGQADAACLDARPALAAGRGQRGARALATAPGPCGITTKREQ